MQHILYTIHSKAYTASSECMADRVKRSIVCVASCDFLRRSLASNYAPRKARRPYVLGSYVVGTAADSTAGIRSVAHSHIAQLRTVLHDYRLSLRDGLHDSISWLYYYIATESFELINCQSYVGLKICKTRVRHNTSSVKKVVDRTNFVILYWHIF